MLFMRLTVVAGSFHDTLFVLYVMVPPFGRCSTVTTGSCVPKFWRKEQYHCVSRCGGTVLAPKIPFAAVFWGLRRRHTQSLVTGDTVVVVVVPGGGGGGL